MRLTAGENVNNQWDWEGNGNKTWLNLGLKGHSRSSQFPISATKCYNAALNCCWYGLGFVRKTGFVYIRSLKYSNIRILMSITLHRVL